MEDMIDKVLTFIQDTNIIEQIKDVDYVALSTNPWFMVPLVGLLVYLLWTKSFKEIIILAILGGVWWSTGTEYMQTLVVGDQIQIKKLLPVVFGGVAALGFIVYLLFISGE